MACRECFDRVEGPSVVVNKIDVDAMNAIYDFMEEEQAVGKFSWNALRSIADQPHVFQFTDVKTATMFKLRFS